jgi:hypothetical protein
MLTCFGHTVCTWHNLCNGSNFNIDKKCSYSRLGARSPYPGTPSTHGRRYFAAWKHRFTLEQLPLPTCMVDATAGGQRSAPFGDGVLRMRDTTLAG